MEEGDGGGRGRREREEGEEVGYSHFFLETSGKIRRCKVSHRCRPK
jgi:hypothetical protein